MECAAYNRAAGLPNVVSHETVDKSVTFVDPATGTRTQNVKSYWNRVKVKVYNMVVCVL